MFLQTYGPIYDNKGFQHEEERPPAYTQAIYPHLPQTIPNYVAATPQTINTHHTTTPGTPHNIGQLKKGNNDIWLMFE